MKLFEMIIFIIKLFSPILVIILVLSLNALGIITFSNWVIRCIVVLPIVLLTPLISIYVFNAEMKKHNNRRV